MSAWVGDFRPGQVVQLDFNTIDTTGAPAAIASGAIAILKDGTVVTPSGGVTFTASAGGVTGYNTIVIDTSVDTTTFTAGSDYKARLSAGTVSSVSQVGRVVGRWSIANRGVVINSSGYVTLASGQTFSTTGSIGGITGIAFPTNFSLFAIDAAGRTNVGKIADIQVYGYEGILAAGTSSSQAVFPSEDAAGNSIPDDGRFANAVLSIVQGTGAGQNNVILGARTGTSTYAVVSAPGGLDATSAYITVGYNRARIDQTDLMPAPRNVSSLADSSTQLADVLWLIYGFASGKLVVDPNAKTLSIYSITGTLLRQFSIDSVTAPLERE